MATPVPEARRRRLTVAGVLVVAALLAAAAWQGWVEYHLRAARRLAGRHDFAAALDQLGRCRFAWPRDGEVLFLSARTARRAGRAADAEGWLAACKARGYDPEAVTLERALLRAQQGELGLVEPYLWHAVEAGHPDAPLILETLALQYLHSFRLPAAVRCLDLWLERDPGAVPALLWRAEAARRLRLDGQARDDYRRALDLDPELPEARERLAELLLTAGAPAEAREHFERLAAARPDDPAALLGLARCHRQLGEPARARALLERLLAARPDDAAALAERGRLAMDAGRPAEAEPWLRRAAEATPYEEEVVYPLLLCLQQLGKDDEAAAWQARLDRIRADLARLRDVVRRIPESPADPDLRREAGEILLRNGQEEEGLRWLRSALEQDPANRPTHRALADYFERHGDKAEARRHRELAGG